MSSRAQVGLEYLTFTAFLLLVAVILFAYSFVQYSTSVQLVQTQAATDQIASAVDFVYAKGPGNTVIVDVTLPSGLTEFRVDQNVVRTNLTLPSGSNTLFTFTKVKINSQYLYYEPGIYSVRVSMWDVNASVTNV